MKLPFPFQFCHQTLLICKRNGMTEKMNTSHSPASSSNVPQINQNQQTASIEFLTSSPRSITLVQDPPGTRKTSMLTMTVYESLNACKAADVQPRLVCAHSNKTVTVLAHRYLKAENECFCF